MSESASSTASIGKTSEEDRLADLEVIVERGLATFVEVGHALMEIRDGRLYRDSHGSFEDYCRERWQMRREIADRYVRSAEVVAIVNPIGLPSPANEAQARELAPLLDQPERLREAWSETQALSEATGKPVTSKLVREVVEQKRPKPIILDPSDEVLEKIQRDTLISTLDRAIYSLESPPSTALAEAQRLLETGGPGPFTPSRFERAIAYAQAFAEALREAGIDG